MVYNQCIALRGYNKHKVLMMDLTGIEGLTTEQVEAITALHSQDVEGLKGKNTELLGKMDGYKGDLTAKEQALEDARKVAADAEIKSLESQGKYEEAKKLNESELAKMVAREQELTKSAQGALKQRDLKDVKFGILSKVQEPLRQAAEALLDKITDVTYDDSKNAIPSIKYADKEFNNTADFLEFAKTDPTFSALLGAPNTQGFDVNKTNAKGFSGVSRSKMSADEKAAFIEKHGQESFLKLPK